MSKFILLFSILSMFGTQVTALESHYHSIHPKGIELTERRQKVIQELYNAGFRKCSFKEYYESRKIFVADNKMKIILPEISDEHADEITKLVHSSAQLFFQLFPISCRTDIDFRLFVYNPLNLFSSEQEKRVIITDAPRPYLNGYKEIQLPMPTAMTDEDKSLFILKVAICEKLNWLYKHRNDGVAPFARDIITVLSEARKQLYSYETEIRRLRRCLYTRRCRLKSTIEEKIAASETATDEEEQLEEVKSLYKGSRKYITTTVRSVDVSSNIVNSWGYIIKEFVRPFDWAESIQKSLCFLSLNAKTNVSNDVVDKVKRELLDPNSMLLKYVEYMLDTNNLFESYQKMQREICNLWPEFPIGCCLMDDINTPKRAMFPVKKGYSLGQGFQCLVRNVTKNTCVNIIDVNRPVKSIYVQEEKPTCTIDFTDNVSVDSINKKKLSNTAKAKKPKKVKGNKDKRTTRTKKK